MFEQTFVNNTAAARKPWPVAASMTGQLIVVGIIFMIPFMNTARIAFTPPLVIYSPMRIVPPAVAVQRSTTASTSTTTILRPLFQPRFTAPTHIPDKIATSVGEMPEVPVITGMAGTFSQIVGGLPFGDTISNLKPPEPIKAVAAKKRDAVRVSVGVQQAMLIQQIKPAYPPLARSARISGTVRLTAVIATDGTIQRLQVISGHPLLVKAALEAVGQWRYKPTLLSGEPVEVITEIDVNFTLSN